MCSTAKLIIYFSILIFAGSARAAAGSSGQPLDCINGDVGHNAQLFKSLQASKDDLYLAFLKSQKSSAKPLKKAQADENGFEYVVKTDIDACFITDTKKKDFNFLTELVNFITHSEGGDTEQAQLEAEANKALSEIRKTPPNPPAKLIKRECIEASMKRAPGNEGFTCNYPTAKEAKHGFPKDKQSVLKSYGTAGGSNLQCVTQSMVDYMTFAVNSAIQCMSPNDPIDSRVIFKKLNNETAFNFSISSDGGRGIGQTTSYAKNEMTDGDLGKGRPLLESIVSSKKPECDGFKKVASQDLNKPPRVRNSCDWVSPGDGLARSLMYSVGYYLTMRDGYIIPLMEKRSKRLTENKGLVNDLTSVAYGYEGLERVKQLLQKYRAGNGSNPRQLQSGFRTDSAYLQDTKKKMQEFNCIRQGIDPRSANCKKEKTPTQDLEGDTCISD